MSGHGWFNKCELTSDEAPTVLCLVSHWVPPMAPSVNKRLLQYHSHSLKLALSMLCILELLK